MASSSVRLASSSTMRTRTGDPSARTSLAVEVLVGFMTISVARSSCVRALEVLCLSCEASVPGSQRVDMWATVVPQAGWRAWSTTRSHLSQETSMTTTPRDELGPNTEVFAPVSPTESLPYAVPSAPAVSAASGTVGAAAGVTAADGAATAPAVRAPTWSGKKTAIAAALAIGLSGVGAVSAAALVPAGTGSQSGDGPGGQLGRGGPGGTGGGFGRGGQGGQLGPTGQQGQVQQGRGQLGQTGQLPGQGDPNAGAGAAANATSGTATG